MHHIDVSQVRPLRLPWSSSWRPPMQWCAQKLSGWRHSGILKTHALHHLLSVGWNVFFVDTDWRFAANPIPDIIHLGRDVVAARDQTRHMLNVGVLWVRSSEETIRVAWRTFNRTLWAWDQAVFTEEAGASKSVCCWTDTGRHVIHPLVSREAKLSLRSQQQECAPASKGDTSLEPPLGVESRRMFPHWKPRSYNSLPSAFYRCLRATEEAQSSTLHVPMPRTGLVLPIEAARKRHSR